MNRHQHPSNNDVLRAPPGATIDDCMALPITRVRYGDGTNAVVSYWLPTTEELGRLNAGKAIGLLVMGVTHPPLYIAVDGDEALPQ